MNIEEPGYWVEVGPLRAWVSSAHLVPGKERQLRDIWNAQESHERQSQGLEPHPDKQKHLREAS
jgi:hypothetical protein